MAGPALAEAAREIQDMMSTEMTSIYILVLLFYYYLQYY